VPGTEIEAEDEPLPPVEPAPAEDPDAGQPVVAEPAGEPEVEPEPPQTAPEAGTEAPPEAPPTSEPGAGGPMPDPAQKESTDRG